VNILPIGAGVIVFLALASIIGAFKPRSDFGEKFQAFLSIVALLLAYLAYKETSTLVIPARIHFDNGYNIPYEVVIDNETRVSIAASGVTMVKLPRGNHSIEIFTNGDTFETYQINCTGNRDYIYNIGGMFVYYVVTHTYGDGGVGVSRPSYPQKVGDGRFFLMPNVSYGLDQAVPGSITVEASQRSATRTSLKRELAVPEVVQTTPTPTRTQMPASTPLPVEVTFDTIGNYPAGHLVILVGRLAMTSSIRCCLSECGLLLENPARTSQTITIFVTVGFKPNQMKSLPDQYTKSDIQVQLNDGTFAVVGYRIRVTGKVCSSTSKEPCISEIMKIELFQVK
jgi:hypothetical protein